MNCESIQMVRKLSILSVLAIVGLICGSPFHEKNMILKVFSVISHVATHNWLSLLFGEI